MRTLAHVLASKGSTVWAISPEATVYEALQVMAQHNVGALLIIEGGAPVGMISERDYARKIVLVGRSSLDTRVRVVMTTPLTSCPSSHSIDAAMVLMTRTRVRHLPVIDGGRLLGLVSIGDLVKARIADQQFTIAQLEQYIAT
jgi:CBS domain-containing protein